MSPQKRKTPPSHKILLSSSDIAILIACVVAIGLAGYLLSNAVQLSIISKEKSSQESKTKSYLSEPTLVVHEPSLPEVTVTPEPEPEIMQAIFPIPTQYLQNGEKSEIKIDVRVFPGYPHSVNQVDTDPNDDSLAFSNVIINNKTYELRITRATGGMYCPKEPCTKTGEQVFQYPNDFVVWRDGSGTVYAITTEGVRLGEYRPDVIVIDGVSSVDEVEMWKQILKSATIRKKTP